MSFSNRFFKTSKPRHIAHRGASGIRPENTLIAFEVALQQGAEIFELDVHASRDGTIMVIHDSALERTTNGEGEVRRKTLSELRALDAGYRFVEEGKEDFPFRDLGVLIPTLDEVIERFPETPLNIEVKQDEPPIDEAVIALLKRHNAIDRTLLAAGEPDIMERIRALRPGAALSFSGADVMEFIQAMNTDALDSYEPPGHAIQIPESVGDVKLLTPSLVRAARRKNVEVHIWTINRIEDMRRLIHMGVHGIMTDYPDRLTQALKQIKTLFG